MKRLTILSVAAAAAAIITLTGCSSSDSTAQPGPTTSTGSAASAPHNQADATFATDMIPHHAQAIEMADMAASQATSPKVKSLAVAIKKAQDPEIATMSGWLRTWDKPVPSTTMDHSMGGMHMGSGTGMMSEADMAALGKASGARFDRLWVTMMITHHEGAVAMARTELATGSNTDAKSLARSIISSQNAEIQQMRSLLTNLPGK